jgi:Cu/Ag efflux protein CusF
MNKKFTKYILAGVAVTLYAFVQQLETHSPGISSVAQHSGITVQSAFNAQQSDLQIQGEGVVKKVLADDRKGSQHQKFILQVSPEQTVLVAHNIDVASRLPGIKRGDRVEFYGEYEWTTQGGVIHWTHHDRSGRHINGWLKYNGKKYQ